MSDSASVVKLQFSTRQVLGESWEILKVKWPFLLGFWATIFGVNLLAEIIRAATTDQNELLMALASLAVQVLLFIIGIGAVKVMLKVTRGETAEISELFTNNMQYVWQYLLLSLVLSLVIGFGFLLLIVPGVIWSLKYMFASYALIDKKLSFSDAMNVSDQMTRGIKWQLFGFGCAIMGLNLLGLLAIGLGLIITIPVSMLAGYVLYEQLKKQLPDPAPASAPALKV